MKYFTCPIIYFFAFLFVTNAQHSRVEGAKSIPNINVDQRLEQAFSFFVLGDWGFGGKSQRRVAEGMAKKIRSDGANAVFLVGDNFLPNGVNGLDDIQWETKFERMYPADVFPIPFFATLGNHDHNGNTEAQLAYCGKKLIDGTVTRWQLPALYWAKHITIPETDASLLLIGLDTPQIIGTDSNACNRQLAWLDSVLQTSTDTWKIVIGHHPVFSNGMHGNTIGMQRHVQPLFEKHGVNAYFAGHDHDLQLLESVGGVQYIISGGGGSSRNVQWKDNTIFAATNLGFVWGQINRDTMLLQFMNPDGDAQFVVEIPRGTR